MFVHPKNSFWCQESNFENLNAFSATVVSLFGVFGGHDAGVADASVDRRLAGRSDAGQDQADGRVQVLQE